MNCLFLSENLIGIGISGFGKLDFRILDILEKALVREIGIRKNDFGKRYIRENGLREIVRQGYNFVVTW